MTVETTPKGGEWNFDGIAGPTHFFAGLAHGNIMSQRHRFHTSHPKLAALQCLDKMSILCRAGVPQGFWPPAVRPNIRWLRQYGFEGPDERVWECVWQKRPEWALACLSSSFMWVANAATHSPLMDCADKNSHLTPANLIAQPHRHLEVQHHTQVLRMCFQNTGMRCHDPLPVSDEGAANHMRLAPSWDVPGLEIFVYGCDGNHDLTMRFRPRQSKAASRLIAEQHRLFPDCVLFLQQNPLAIDAGVFHNDVIALNHEDILIAHEDAYQEKHAFEMIEEKYHNATGRALRLFVIPHEQMTLQEAVDTYVFNSQLVTINDNGQKMLIMAKPLQAHAIAEWFAMVVPEHFEDVQRVEWVDLSESLRNGGGPACLRLRIILTEVQAACIPEPFVMNEAKINSLRQWVCQHYREQLRFDDLKDPQLIREVYSALDDLTQRLGLGDAFYDFQKA